MAQHRVWVAGSTGAWQARCACRQQGPVEEHHWDATRWGDKHLEAVERVRATRGFGPGASMALTAAYYRSMADNPEVDEHDRALWDQLAGELEARLGVHHPIEESPLF